MPEMTDPMFDRAVAEVIAWPDSACGAAARIVDRWTSESTGGRVEHAKPAASAATGSLPWSSRSPPHLPLAEPGPVGLSMVGDQGGRRRGPYGRVGDQEP
jgi:hypothetical protein